MDPIYADFSISMSEFKRNPSHIARVAGDKPVAVLSHNKPAFYMVSPRLFEAILSALADQNLDAVIKDRLARRHESIPVRIDDL